MVARIDPRYVATLPDAASAQAQQWLADALAAMQAADPRPDMDFGGVEARLAALEGRAALAPDALDDVVARLDALEARVAALEARGAVFGGATSLLLDPLTPQNWVSLEDAKAALVTFALREAARRMSHSVELYERMTYLDAIQGTDAMDADGALELMQHERWAEMRGDVERARQAHVAAIGALPSLDAARAYDVTRNWPEARGDDARG